MVLIQRINQVNLNADNANTYSFKFFKFKGKLLVNKDVDG